MKPLVIIVAALLGACINCHAQTIPSRIGLAKTSPIATIVTLDDKTVTVAPQASSPSPFYIQEPDRSAGIKVIPQTGSPAPVPGDQVSVTGTISTVAGETVIADALLTSTQAGALPAAINLSSSSISYWLKGIGLSPTGLYATLLGKIIYREPSGKAVVVSDRWLKTNPAGTNLKTGETLNGLRIIGDFGNMAVGETIIVKGCIGRMNYASPAPPHPTQDLIVFWASSVLAVPQSMGVTLQIEEPAGGFDGRPVLIDAADVPGFQFSSLSPTGNNLRLTEAATGMEIPYWWQDFSASTALLWFKPSAGFDGRLTVSYTISERENPPVKVVMGGADFSVHSTIATTRIQKTLLSPGQPIDGVNFHFFHLPYLHKMPDGRLALFLAGGADSTEHIGTKYLFAMYSEDEGDTWSEPHLLSTPQPDNTTRHPLGIFNDGARVYLLYTEFTTDNEPAAKLWSHYSDDGGVSWSEPVDTQIPPVILSNNRAGVLSNGDWLMAGGESALISTDKGLSWQKYTVPRTSALQGGPNETAWFESLPGVVEFYTRCSRGVLAYSKSVDYGRTWTPWVESDIINPQTKPEAIKLRDGTIVFFNNEWRQKSPSEYGGRRNLQMRFSWDGGRTWPSRVMFDDSYDGNNIQYPTLYEKDNGDLVVVFVRSQLTNPFAWYLRQATVQRSEWTGENRRIDASYTWGVPTQADGHGMPQLISDGIKLTRHGHGALIQPADVLSSSMEYPIYVTVKGKYNLLNSSAVTWNIATIYTGNNSFNDEWCSIAHRPSAQYGKYSILHQNGWAISNTNIPSGDAELVIKLLDDQQFQVYSNGQLVTAAAYPDGIFRRFRSGPPKNFQIGRGQHSYTTVLMPGMAMDFEVYSASVAANPILYPEAAVEE